MENTQFLAAVALFAVMANFSIDIANQKDVRYCQRNGSDEVIIVRAPALCPPGTFEI